VPASPLRLLGRRRGDPAPTEPVTVVLASTGRPISDAAVDRAVALTDATPAAVVTVARVHGSAFGLPNPGLMPSAREREEQRTIVSTAIDRLGRHHVTADGQVIVTRNGARAIARVARARGARFVVLDAPAQGRVRRWLEGDPGRTLRRALRERAEVVLV
jgi:hypothetical protein